MSHQPTQRQQSGQSGSESMNETSEWMQSSAGGSQLSGMQPSMQSGMQSGDQQMRTTEMSGRSPQTQPEPGMQEMNGQTRSGSMQGQGQGGGMQRMQGRQEQGSGMQQSQSQPRAQTGGGRSFEDHLTNELRIVLEDFTELSHVTGWCAKECAGMGPQLRTCARICQDIAEIAELNEKMLARDSMFGSELAETFLRVAIKGLPELRQYSQQHSHIAETVATIERTMESCRTVLEMIGQQGQQGRMGQTGQMGQTEQTGPTSTMQGQGTGQSTQRGRMNQRGM